MEVEMKMNPPSVFHLFRHRRMGFWLVVVVFLTAACESSYEKERRVMQAEHAKMKTEDSLALKVAVLPTIDCLPLFVAEECRLFDTLGVDVRLKLWNAQMDCDTALAGGTVEGAVTDLVRAERMAQRGTSLQYVAATNASWQLITNRTARLKAAKQLGDKMVAMTRFSATDMLTDMALDGVKTTADVYRVQINNVNLRLQMLKNNEMDALWLPEPQATAARELKNPVIWDSDKNDLHLGVIAFRQKAYEDKRIKAQIDGFLKAYDLAIDSINQRGLRHYAAIIMKYCAVEDSVVAKLPKMTFPHAAPPRQQDVETARKWLKR